MGAEVGVIRRIIRNSAILISFFCLSILFVFPADSIISIKGIVKDSLGNVLSGVDIFVSSDNFNSKVFNTRTNEKGQYTLERLSAGSYKVAAAKNGYLTKIEDVSVQKEASLNLTLNPIAGEKGAQGDASTLPDTLDWIRRIPKKDVLKETDAATVVEGKDDTDQVSQEALARFNFATLDNIPVRIELKQVASKDFTTSEMENSSEKKNTTELSLSGRIGPDCEVEMEGFKSRWKESSSENLLLDSLKRDAELIGVTGKYDFGEWGTLGFETFYGKDDLNIKKGETASFNPLESSQKEWGYAAGWKKKIDADMAFNIHFAHFGQQFSGDDPFPEMYESSDKLLISHQEVNAAGNFQVQILNDHTIDVGIKTQFYSTSDPLFRILSQRTRQSYYGFGEMGRHISFYGRDSWKVFNPVTISFGFNYYNFYYENGVQAITPVVAMEYRSESGTTLKTELSYIIDATRTEENSSELPLMHLLENGRRERDVSCTVNLKRDLKDGSSITTRFSYTPLLLLSRDNDVTGMMWDDISLYITDGNASSKRAGAFVEKKFKSLNGGIGLDYGEIEGTFSSLLPDDLPLQVFREGNLDYLLAMIRAYCSETDTELAVKYRRVRDSINEENYVLGDSTPLKYSMLSVQFGQEIPVMKGRGVNLKAILEYDDVLAYDDLGSDPMKSLLLPAKRIGGGFLVIF